MRSSDWLPMKTAPLNPDGQAYGPVVLIWNRADEQPWPAQFEPMYGWQHRDTGPAWVVFDGVGDSAIAPEDAVAWMPIVPLPDETRDEAIRDWADSIPTEGEDTMKTRDEAIRDWAERAQNQCEALAEKMDGVVSGWGEEGDPEAEHLCGIGRDRDGRSMLVFAEPGNVRQRTVVYVDAILALAKLLNGEVQVGND